MYFFVFDTEMDTEIFMQAQQNEQLLLVFSLKVIVAQYRNCVGDVFLIIERRKSPSLNTPVSENKK